MSQSTPIKLDIIAPSVTDAFHPPVFDADPRQSAERLAENTVAAMDDQMQELPDNPVAPGIRNAMWAESRGRQSDLFPYDADRYMRSPANVPPDSPDLKNG